MEYFYRKNFQHKSKPGLTGVLYRPPDECDFLKSLVCIFSYTNIIETQEYYLLDDVNIDFQPKDKQFF